LDGMNETQFDIYDVICSIKVSETVKQNLFYWVRETKKGKEGRKGAANRLCKIASVLRNQGNITAEQQLQIVIFARQKEQKPSDNGIWTRFKCFLKRLF